jgi:hypothetical protein
VILDTAFVIDVWDGDDRAVALAEGLDRERTQQKLSSVTVFELYTGVGRSSKPETEREKVLAVLGSKPVVPATETVMSIAGRIHGELAAAGERIEQNDCIIAATALTGDEPVVTRNVSYFERIDGVRVRTY